MHIVKEEKKMRFVIRVVIVILLSIVAVKYAGDIEVYGKIIITLVFLGSVSILLGPYATGGGFWVRFHYVSTGTPSCVWTFFGVVCWVAAVVLYVMARTHP